MRVTARALLTAVVVEATIRRETLETLCDRAGMQFGGFSGGDAAAQVLPRDVAERWWGVVRVLDRWPVARRRRCLRQALVLGRQVRHLNPVLRLEISDVENFRSHAWLEVLGNRLDVGDLEHGGTRTSADARG